MDEGIGKMIERLKRNGAYDNTMILFLSDNGGCHERISGRIKSDTKDSSLALKAQAGPSGSYVSYGKPWANLSNTPFRLHKSTIYEGGISSPLIVKNATQKQGKGGQTRQGELLTGPRYITDLMPAMLHAAGIKYPKSWQNQPLEGMEGNERLDKPNTKPYCWEHYGSRGVRAGQWKLVSLNLTSWELYDIVADRTEQKNLATAKPEVVKELAAVWDTWAAKVKVLPKLGARVGE